MTDPQIVDHDCRSRENASVPVDVNTGFENQEDIDDSAAQVNVNDNLEDHQNLLETNGIESARNYEDGRYIMTDNEAEEGALDFAALHSGANVEM